MFKEFLTKKISRGLIDEFVSKHESDKATLDIGCCNSTYSKYFSNRTGIDTRNGEGVDVIGDAHKLPFENESFEVVLCTEVMEHLHSPHIAVAEMSRVLKPGGILILTTRFIMTIHDAPNDYFRYTKYGLKYLLKDWDIIELKEEVETKNVFAVLLQRLGYQCKFRINFLFKVLTFLTAKIIYILPSPIKEEYGDIRHRRREENILTSGYFVLAKKR